MTLTLSAAQTIVQSALAQGRASGFRPLSVVVLDARGAVIAAASEDGTSLKRFEVAKGKADGSLAFGLGSRALAKLAVERPHFFAGAAHVLDGLVPVPGGVLVRDGEGKVLGAVGVSGDTSDNDEVCALAGIAAAGFRGDGG